MTTTFAAPFPYFGGKRGIAPAIWERLGADAAYVEPFAGSAAMLLARPGWSPGVGWVETINDADGMVANFWRALRSDPSAVAAYADWPVNENDLHARHAWLVGVKESLRSRLEGDPAWCDARIAGWWVWGMSCWIGGGFCSGDGPWHVVNGELVDDDTPGARRRVQLGPGRGVQRQRVQAGDQRRSASAGTGEAGLYAWMEALAARLARVRVCCGDWSRVLSPTARGSPWSSTPVAVFLDPPYSHETGRDTDIYAQESAAVAADVGAWCAATGDDPGLRIALCGYDTEHGELAEGGWTAMSWSTQGGYSNRRESGNANRHRETVWFSPHCVAGPQGSLFAQDEWRPLKADDE